MSALRDLDVNERHGVGETVGQGFIDVRDWEDFVKVTLGEGGLKTPQNVRLVPAEARYLARKLYRLARRVEARQI